MKTVIALAAAVFAVLATPARADQMTQIPVTVGPGYGSCVAFMVAGDDRAFGLFREDFILSPINTAAADNQPVTFSFDSPFPIRLCQHHLVIPVTLAP